VSLESLVLSTAAAASAKLIYPALLDAVQRKQKVTIDVGDIKVEFDPDRAAEFAELITRLADEVPKQPANVLELSREAADPSAKSSSPEDINKRTAVGTLALATSPDALFRDARRRIAMVFRLNFGVALVLATILLMGIAGAIISAVFLRQNTWALAFGGVTVADLLGVYVFKPLKVINASLVATQRLDSIHLRLHKQLPECDQLETPKERLQCQTELWKSIESELASLA